MVGGEVEAFARAGLLLRDLAVLEGLLHAGPAGARHFVKLIHNAIEFGMVRVMRRYARCSNTRLNRPLQAL
jgi:6-phosphogluconate dehydrogenase (decarboxylating)